MLKSLIKNAASHAAHVALGALIAGGSGFAALIAAHIPSSILGGAVQINGLVVATLIISSITSALTKASGGK